MEREVIEFIGIGVGRSGTTWLSKCLGEHPQIRMSADKSAKEIRFFDFLPRFELGSKWYFSQFPPARAGYIRGEFSPFYYASAKAAPRIRALLPDVKLVAILRNPIDVVNSYFWYHRGAPWEDIGAKSLTELEKQGDPYNVLALGNYFTHFKSFLEIFPRENIHIIIYEQMCVEKERHIRELLRFLGVEATFNPPSINAVINRTVALSSTPISNILREVSLGIMWILRDVIIANPKIEERLHSAYRVMCSDRRSIEVSISDEDRGWLSKVYRDEVIAFGDLTGKDVETWWGIK